MCLCWLCDYLDWLYDLGCGQALALVVKLAFMSDKNVKKVLN